MCPRHAASVGKRLKNSRMESGWTWLGFWSGASRARDRTAARQDRAADGGERFFRQEVRTMSAPDRRAKLDRDHPRLSLRRQCAMLGIARSGSIAAECGERRRAGAAASDRRAVHALAVPRLTTDDGDAAGRGTGDQPQACAAAAASDGDRGPGAEAADDEASAGTHDLSVSACST